MRNILLDECLPKKLKYRIAELNSDFQVKTVAEMGWGGLLNGELLTAMHGKFDTFITSDQNLSYQQSFTGKSIAIIVLIAKSNDYDDLQPLVSGLKNVILKSKSGSVIEVSE